MLNNEEKLQLYKETLESIVISGHIITSPQQVGQMLSHVIEMARSSLEKAGDIEVD